MKTWIDKLREMPIDRLRQIIEREKQEIQIKQRDLATMERILTEMRGEAQLPPMGIER